MILDLNSSSPKDTFGLGESLGRILKGKELILLNGELGVGKTIFAKGVGNSIGINRKEIVSPSYTLMNVYEGKFKLFHIDLYRIGEFVNRGIPEIDDNLDRGIIIVEWAGFVKEYYSTEKNLIDVSISTINGEASGRKISFSTEMEFSL